REPCGRERDTGRIAAGPSAPALAFAVAAALARARAGERLLALPGPLFGVGTEADEGGFVVERLRGVSLHGRQMAGVPLAEGVGAHRLRRAPQREGRHEPRRAREPGGGEQRRGGESEPRRPPAGAKEARPL